MKKQTSYTFQLSKSEKSLPNDVQQSHIHKSYPVVEICLKSASNLQEIKAGTNPYVALFCGERKLQSSVKKGTSITFDEWFEFSVTLDKDKIPVDKFRIDVYSSKFLAKHDFLGTHWIELVKLPKEKTTEMTVKLEGVSSGDVSLTLTPYNFGDESQKQTNQSTQSTQKQESFNTKSSLTGSLVSAPKESTKEQPKTNSGGGSSGSSGSKKLVGMNRYEPIKMVNKGGFGSIYIAKDLKTQKEVILKQVVCENDQDASEKLGEFTPMIRLKHPNLISYLDLFLKVESEQFNICYIMDYYKIGDLSKYITKKKRKEQFIEKVQVYNYSLQLLKGLDYLHDQDMMHRDLKAANVLISDDFKNLVICDFGMVRELSNKSLACTVLGTPTYMAPEITLEKPYNKTADTWSMGIILYELVTLNLNIMHYLKALEDESKYHEKLKDDIIKVSKDFSSFADLVINMLQVDPLKRIPLKDAIKILEKLLDEK